MVDPSVIHAITIEMCTGFLILAGISAIARLAADVWLRRLRGHVARFDRWAENVSKFAEPATYFALVAGVGATFLSMVTGSLAWPMDQLIASPTVHNKVLTTATSQAVFIGAIVLRARYKIALWTTRVTSVAYVGAILTGVGLMTVQNSVAGHLAGKGSVLDDLLHALNIDATQMWAFPQWASLVILVAFPLAALAFGLVLRSADRGARAAAPA